MSGTDVTITTMSSGTRWIDTARQASTYRAGRVLLGIVDRAEVRDTAAA
ncbi:hypothetical protein ABGB07_45660 [Micromonosporaceae bacterium B7E4]